MKTEILIITATLLLLVIQYGIIFMLYRKVSRLEDSIERITIYLHMCADGSPSGIQKCAEAMKRMNEAISKMGVKVSTSREG